MAAGNPQDASSPQVGLAPWQLRTVLIVLLTGQLLSALDQTIVGTALPTMVGEFGQIDSFSLVVTSYLLTTTAAMALYGKLGDMYGPKPVYMFSIAIFTAGSLLVGFSQDMTQLVLFRAVQGIGAGGLVVLAFTISASVVPPRQLGRVQGMVGAMYALASLVGPLVGGAFTEYVSWRWCFWINVPIGLIGLVVLARNLKLPRISRPVSVDYLGATLLVATISVLVLVSIWGGTEYAWGSPQMLGLIAAAVLLTAAFLAWERRAKEPIVPLGIFRVPEIALAMVITFVIGVATIGAYFFLPIYLQVVRGDDPTMAGLNLLPLMIAVMLGSGLSGWLIAAVLGRTKVVVVAGVATMAGGLFLLSLLDASTPAWRLWLYQAVLGLGMGMVISKLIIAVQNLVSRRELGAITAQANFIRVIGSAIGAAVFGALLAAGLVSAGTSSATSNAVYQDPAAIKELATTQPEVYPQVIEAFTGSLRTVFLTAGGLMVVAFVLAWFLPNTVLRDQHGHGHGDAPEREKVGAGE
ncbi:MAG TPA: MDR family MFS transporter [Actinophytocola sp.]|nr:MDR family MFS transporter [Actinophytocola sp.]